MARFTLDRRWKLAACCLGLALRSANAADAVTPAPVAPLTLAPVVSTLAPVSATEAPVVATAAPIVPATTAPTVPATVAPVVQETPSPSIAPVTQAPVVPPSLAPVTPAPTTLSPVTPAPVTLAPSAAAPVTSSPTTIAPTTLSPSFAPTVPDTLPPSPAPSLPEATPSPTQVETSAPSVSPTTAAPIVGTAAPSTTPPVSAAPTSAKPTVATPSPTARSTPAPTSRLFAPPIEYGLSMTLTGVSPLNTAATRIWERTTSQYVYDFYDVNIVGVANVTAVFDVTTQNPPFTARRLRGSGRQLQTQLLTLTFNQQVTFRTDDTSVTAENVIMAPFIKADSRAVYVQTLKATGNAAFENIQSSSQISFPEGGDEGLGLGAIIGIAVGGAVGLLLLLCVLYYYCRGNNSKEGGSNNGYTSGVSGDAPVATVKGRMHAMSDEISNLDDPTTAENKFSSRNESPHGGGYGDQSVATVDYDYSKAYGGGGEASVVSSAGGTFGSGTHGGQTTSGLSNPAGANMLGASFSDDGSFGAMGATNNTKEELIDIYAPPGKLGVVIDTPDDGAPVVHAIKDSSVIADKLQVGDKLVAVDDEDVRTMTAIKVSKLISRKSANATRKLSIIRVTVGGE